MSLWWSHWSLVCQGLHAWLILTEGEVCAAMRYSPETVRCGSITFCAVSVTHNSSSIVPFGWEHPELPPLYPILIGHVTQDPPFGRAPCADTALVLKLLNSCSWDEGATGKQAPAVAPARVDNVDARVLAQILTR